MAAGLVYTVWVRCFKVVLSEVPHDGSGQEGLWLSAGMCRASVLFAMGMGSGAQVQIVHCTAPLARCMMKLLLLCLTRVKAFGR